MRHLHNRTLVVEPALRCLADLAVERVTAPSAPGGNATKVSHPLAKLGRSADGRLGVQLHAGMEAVVRGLLRRRGVEVVAFARPEIDIPPVTIPRTSPRAWVGIIDRGLIRFIDQTPTGIIYIDRSRLVDVAYLIAQVAVAKPDTFVLVLVADHAQRWAQELGRFIPNVGISTHKTPYEGGSQVVVATPGALGMIGIGRAGIVIVADPLYRVWDDPLLAPYPMPAPTGGETYSVSLLERLMDTRGRLYALLPRNHRPSPFEAARLIQMFGMESYVVAGHGRTERPVRVAWEPLTGGPTPAPGDGALQVKETVVWTNRLLARRAAALARHLAAGDRNALRTPYPASNGGLLRDGPNRVLVLVEGPDHAELLAGRLPGWRVVTSTTPAPSADASTEPAGVIATALGAERLVGEDFDVLVRLDLGVGLPPLPLPQWLDTTDPEPTPLLLIDFSARSHPLLRQWQATRDRAYREAGWLGAAADPDEAAYDHFVDLISPRRSRP